MHSHTPRISPQITRTLLAAITSLGLATSLNAASQTWTGATDANWATGTNWSGGAAPGGNSTLSTDVATFNSTLNGIIGGAANPIVVDSGRRIGGLSFGASAGAYVIGSNAGNVLTLGTRGPGYNGSSSTVVAAGTTASQVIAAPITFVQPSSTNGQHGFVNNATDGNVTLTLSGNMSLNTTRPTIVVLDGSNQGNNAITGTISFTGSNQATALLIKRGASTWVLSGSNTMSGTPATSTNSNHGIQVLDGVLSLRNNLALGTSAQVWVGNKTSSYSYNSTTATSYTSSLGGGLLEVANGITLDNGLTLNLVNGGTLRSSGNNTVNSFVKIDSASGTTATLSTVGSSDVFTVGNASNDLNGGISDSIIRVSGPGTIHLGQSSNYAGSWSLNSGTLRLGNASALGSGGGVAFGASSTGKLQLNGNNVSITALNTNATLGTPIVENGAAGNSTLTLTSSANHSYAGTLQDGATGALSFTKAGGGVLSLSGANTYTGGTSVTGGTLRVNNVSGSATGSGAVAIGNTTVLAGSGFITGPVTIGSGGKISAGNSVGTLTVGSLTLDSGSLLDVEFNGGGNDLIAVTGSGGLTINGGGLNLYAENTTTPWTNSGTYNILSFVGGIGGTGTSALSVLNQQAGYSYSFGSTTGFVTLTISTSGVISDWNANASGSWATAGNWSNTVPDQAGASARFLSAITAPQSVSLDGNRTVGGITFDNANTYTLSQGSGGTLTLDSGTTGSTSILVSNGQHAIAVPVSLSSNLTIDTAAATSLSVSGAIAGAKSITKSGSGTLDLTGANTYSGGTVLDAGTLSFSNGGLSSGDITIDGGTLVFNSGNTEDISTGRAVTLAAGGAVLDTNGNNVVLASSIGNLGSGSLTKSGSGSLSLSGSNTYTGATIVNSGTLEVNSNASLGSVSSGASLTVNGATLLVSDNVTLDNAGANARPLNIGASGATISVAADKTLVVSGKATGSSALVKNGAGTLVLAADNATVPASLTSAITVNGGTLAAGGAAANGQLGLGTGSITLNDATLALNGAGQTSGSYGTLSNSLVVPTGKTGSVTLPANITVSSALTGAGTLNVAVLGSGQNYQGNWSAFTGNINLTGSGQFRIANFQSSVFNNSALNIGSGVTVFQTFNPPTGTGTETVQNIGSLSGATGSVLGGNPISGRFVNWTVGVLNTNTEFAGSIQDTSGGGAAKLTKIGSGSLTLSGNNTYTGATTINAGSLNVTGALGNTVITVGNSGTLAGFGDGLITGRIAGATTVNGTLRANSAPVNATSRLTFASTLSLAGNTTFDISGANYTGVTLSTAESLTYGGSLNFNFIGAPVDGTYDLFNFTDTNTGSFTAVAVTSIGSLTNQSGVWSGTFGGVTYTFTQATGDLLVSAIPEPSSFAAFAGLVGVAAAGLRRRRRA